MLLFAGIYFQLCWKTDSNESLCISDSCTCCIVAGKYIYVEMSGSARLGAASFLISPQFNPPPSVVSNISSRHYNACYVSVLSSQYEVMTA